MTNDETTGSPSPATPGQPVPRKLAKVLTDKAHQLMVDQPARFPTYRDAMDAVLVDVVALHTSLRLVD